jgi:hypothetical protein
MFHITLRRAVATTLAAGVRAQPHQLSRAVTRHLSQRTPKPTGRSLSKLSSFTSSPFSFPAMHSLRQFATRSGAVGLTSQAKMGWAIAGGAALLGIAAMSADGLAQQQQVWALRERERFLW